MLEITNHHDREEAVNEILADPKSIILGLLAILMSIITWIGKDHMKRLRALEADAVRKADLEKLRKDIADDRMAMHNQNQNKLDRIDATVTSTHQRIDALYRDMVQRR